MTNNDYTLEISVDGGRLEQVDSFTYLGSQMTSNADCVSDVKSRLAMGMAVKSVSTITKLCLKLMTTAQVYKMAGTENELLNHIKSRKLRYFGHVMRQPHDNVEVSWKE